MVAGGWLRGAWHICSVRAGGERWQLVRYWLRLALVGGGNREARQWGQDGGDHGACSARVGDARWWQVAVVR